MDIEEQCSSHGPKSTVHIVSAKLCGVMDGSPCELPSNEHLVTYFKNKIASDLNNKDSDQIFAIMQGAKEDDSIGKFVRETRSSSEPAFIQARDRQL